VPIETSAKIAFLKKIHLFQGLDDEELLAIAEKLGDAHYPAGGVIFEQDKKAESFYLIYGGSVRITRKQDGKRIELAVLVKYDYFGELALVSKRRRSATATALLDTSLLVLSLYVLIIGPPSLLWTITSRNSRFIFWAGFTGVRLALAVVGLRLRLAGEENIQRHTGAVYAANHISNLDPPCMFLSLCTLGTRVKFLYKAELRALPIMVWVFDVAGFVPVERANRGQSLPAAWPCIRASRRSRRIRSAARRWGRRTRRYRQHR